MKSTLEILEGARVELSKYGWRQGTYGSRRTGFCLAGALRYSAEGHCDLPLTEGRAVERAELAIRSLIGSTIPCWNDVTATRRQVFAVLDCAIEAEKKSGCAVASEES